MHSLINIKNIYKGPCIAETLLKKSTVGGLSLTDIKIYYKRIVNYRSVFLPWRVRKWNRIMTIEAHSRLFGSLYLLKVALQLGWPGWQEWHLGILETIVISQVVYSINIQQRMSQLCESSDCHCSFFLLIWFQVSWSAYLTS